MTMSDIGKGVFWNPQSSVIPHHITLTNTYFTLYLCTALHYKYIYHLSFQSDMDMILGKTDIEKRDEVKVYSPDFLIITALTSTTAKFYSFLTDSTEIN